MLYFPGWCRDKSSKSTILSLPWYCKTRQFNPIQVNAASHPETVFKGICFAREDVISWMPVMPFELDGIFLFCFVCFVRFVLLSFSAFSIVTARACPKTCLNRAIEDSATPELSPPPQLVAISSFIPAPRFSSSIASQ